MSQEISHSHRAVTPTWRGMIAVVVAVLLAATLGPSPALSSTEGEVDLAREERDRAADARAAALADLTEAITAYEEIRGEIEQIVYRMGTLRDRIQQTEDRVRGLEGSISNRAVDAYMAGGDGDLIARVFSPETAEQAVIAREVMGHGVDAETEVLDSLVVAWAELDRLREQAATDAAHVEQLRSDSRAVVERMSDLFDEASADADRAVADYTAASEALAEQNRIEEDRLRAEAAIRSGFTVPAMGVPLAATPDFVCPVAGPTWFIDTWHAPRSGGRLHKGTDMFAQLGTPLVAVGDGTVYRSWESLGGYVLWLVADHGVNYYYAHLAAYPENQYDGERVERGQVVGFAGDSGNPAPGAYHLHFGIYPGGVAAVNPYATLRATCA